MTIPDITPAGLAVQAPDCWLVVEVWAHHCAPCKGLEQQLELLKPSLPEGCGLGRLCADEFGDWCVGQGIRSVPVLLLFCAGAEVARHQEDFSLNAIRAFLGEYMPASPDPETLCSQLLTSARINQLRPLVDSLTDEQSRGPSVQRARSWFSLQEINLNAEESALRREFFDQAGEGHWRHALDILSGSLRNAALRPLAVALADLIPDRSLVSQWRRRHLRADSQD